MKARQGKDLRSMLQRLAYDFEQSVWCPLRRHRWETPMIRDFPAIGFARRGGRDFAKPGKISPASCWPDQCREAPRAGSVRPASSAPRDDFKLTNSSPDPLN